MLDSHAHFWDPAELEYPWLDALPALRHAFGPAEYLEDRRGVPVDGVLFVEANARATQAFAEAERVAALAAAHPWIAGIVAFADLTAPGCVAALDALATIPLVRGIRHNIQGTPRGFCLQAPFVAGVREVGRRGLVFDLCATHDQLPDLVRLARLAPDTRFVLDHCGKPAIRERLLDPWREAIRALGELENVDCKISGLLTEAGPGAGVEDLRPFVAHVVESFGISRVMYGSDWPVLTLAGSHSQWYETTRALTDGWSTAERGDFYAANAMRVYGIAQPR